MTFSAYVPDHAPETKMPMWMFPGALAASNCFILKPSERDPSPSLIIAALLEEGQQPVERLASARAPCLLWPRTLCR